MLIHSWCTGMYWVKKLVMSQNVQCNFTFHMDASHISLMATMYMISYHYQVFQCTFNQVEAPSPRKTATRERKMFPTWPIASPISLPRAGWGTGWQLAHLNRLIAIPHILPREGWGFSTWPIASPISLPRASWGMGWQFAHPNLLIAIPHILPREGWGRVCSSETTYPG